MPGPRSQAPVPLEYGGHRTALQEVRPFASANSFRTILPDLRYSDSNNGNNRLSDHTHMNVSSELNFDEMLRIRLAVLHREHRDLDEAILAIEARVNPDQLMLRRLKKQKLGLKEQIVKIEDELIPDIIA